MYLLSGEKIIRVIAKEQLYCKVKQSITRLCFVFDYEVSKIFRGISTILGDGPESTRILESQRMLTARRFRCVHIFL